MTRSGGAGAASGGATAAADGAGTGTGAGAGTGTGTGAASGTGSDASPDPAAATSSPTGGKPCAYCAGSHSESVHTVTDTLGKQPGAPAVATGSPGKAPTDATIYASIDELAAAGHRLFGLGTGLSERLAGALAQIAAIEANNPAGDDDTGQQFHVGYDRVPVKPGSKATVPASVELRESIEVIGDAYAAKGILAQKAAKAYADVDDANAAAAHKYIGIWGV